MKKVNMSLGAEHLIYRNAHRLRNSPTAAEATLWLYLKNKSLGVKFRRQHPIGIYIADFYCHEHKLIIEVDGSIHNLPGIKAKDEEKEQYLISEGLKIIRVTNYDIFNNIETVLNKIKQVVSSPFRGSGGIGIVRYGAGNIFSLTSALHRLNIPYGMVHKAEDFEQFDRIIIPGVGHAGAAMNKLQESGLVPVIKALTKPTLGVCVGMQLLTSYSEEGNADLLNIIPVKTLKFADKAGFKVPHTGWNNVNAEKDNPLFKNIPAGAHFYFVHSYFIEHNPVYTLASTDYVNQFSASIWHNNFYGVQFHPEKSGEYGETLLKNFSKI